MNEIITALAKAIAETKAVPKDGRNKEQSYDYASAEAIIEAARLPLARNGLAVIYDVTECRQLDAVKTRSGAEMARWIVSLTITVWHASGQSLPPVTYTAEGRDTGDKAILKATTACQREHVRQLLLIPRGAFDPEVEEPKKPATLVETLKELSDAIKIELDKRGTTASTQSICEELAKRARKLAGVEGKKPFGVEFAVEAAAQMMGEIQSGGYKP
jgi:hypothetical protein